MSEIFRFGRQMRDFLSGLLDLHGGGVRQPGGSTGGGGGEPPRGTTTSGPMQEFPPAGIDRVRHYLRVILSETDGDGKEHDLEELHFEGHMTLERGEPYRTDEGVRRIDFVVLSWSATAWSDVLQQEIFYVLSEKVEKQPVSTITAEQKDSDFPATFDFNLIFDARANNRPVHHGHHGRPRGHGFHIVPPNGDRFLSPTITGFEDTVIAVRHPERGTTLTFRPKDCNDGSSQTVATRTAAAGAA